MVNGVAGERHEVELENWQNEGKTTVEGKFILRTNGEWQVRRDPGSCTRDFENMCFSFTAACCNAIVISVALGICISSRASSFLIVSSIDDRVMRCETFSSPACHVWRRPDSSERPFAKNGGSCLRKTKPGRGCRYVS